MPVARWRGGRFEFAGAHHRHDGDPAERGDSERVHERVFVRHKEVPRRRHEGSMQSCANEAVAFPTTLTPPRQLRWDGTASGRPRCSPGLVTRPANLRPGVPVGGSTSCSRRLDAVLDRRWGRDQPCDRESYRSPHPVVGAAPDGNGDSGSRGGSTRPGRAMGSCAGHGRSGGLGQSAATASSTCRGGGCSDSLIAAGRTGCRRVSNRGSPPRLRRNQEGLRRARRVVAAFSSNWCRWCAARCCES
jgi:hypothetical protein